MPPPAASPSLTGFHSSWISPGCALAGSCVRVTWARYPGDLCHPGRAATGCRSVREGHRAARVSAAPAVGDRLRLDLDPRAGAVALRPASACPSHARVFGRLLAKREVFRPRRRHELTRVYGPVPPRRDG